MIDGTLAICSSIPSLSVTSIQTIFSRNNAKLIWQFPGKVGTFVRSVPKFVGIVLRRLGRCIPDSVTCVAFYQISGEPLWVYSMATVTTFRLVWAGIRLIMLALNIFWEASIDAI